MVKLPLKIGKCGQLLDDTLCVQEMSTWAKQNMESLHFSYVGMKAESEKEVQQNQAQTYTLCV